MVRGVLPESQVVDLGWTRFRYAFIALLMLVAAGCTSADESIIDVVPVGSPEKVTIEEFTSTVVPAAELLQNAGFTALQQTVLDTGTAEWLWLDYRPEAQQSDYPVPGTWWVVEVVEFAEAEGSRGRVTASVVAGDSLYTSQYRQSEGQDNATWTVQPRPPTDLGMFPLRLLAMPLGQIEDYYRAVNQEFSAELTQQPTEDGGSIWTATHSASSGIEVTETLVVDPSGLLSGYEYQVTRSDSSTTSDTGQLPEPASAGTASIRFSPQPRGEPHAPPLAGESLDLDEFDLPTEIPIDG